MINKIITISNETDFRKIMDNANCETKLHRVGRELDYFKVKINGKFEKFVLGDQILIDDEHKIRRFICQTNKL